MKIIHTADWHLGQTFYGYERSGEHRLFLDWLADTIRTHHADALLIAGDIFDSPNPSAESQRLFYDFIRKMCTACPETKIVATAGNHDSAARLEAPDPLLASFNVTVRGIVHRKVDGIIDYERMIIPLGNDTCCLAVPFLRQGDYPAAESHGEGIALLYSHLHSLASKRYSTIVAMGHLQATGSEISAGDRSERTTIGGLDCVSPNIFSNGFAYTALGHLHRAQRVSGRDNVRYAGAPLPMSFAERNNKQSVTLVTLENGNATIEKIPFEPPVRLVSIPDRPMPLADVIDAIARLPEGENNSSAPYLEIRVAVASPEPTLRKQIEDALENRAVRLARIEAVTERTENRHTVTMTYDELKKISPIEMATNAFRHRYGQEQLPQRMHDMLAEVIKEIGEDNI